MFINSYYRDNNYKLIENFEDVLIQPSECSPTLQKFYSERLKQTRCFDPKKKPVVYVLPTECSSGYEKTNNMCRKIQAPAPAVTSSAPATVPATVPATLPATLPATVPALDINNIIEVPSKCNNNEILKNNNCHTKSGNLLGPTFCDSNYIKIGGLCRSNINTNNSKIILSNPSTLDKNMSNYFGIYNMPKSYFEPVYGYPLYYWEGLQQIDNNLDVIKRLTLSDNVNIDNSKYNNIFNKRYLIIINNTSITNNIPTNYATFRLPIDPNTHNSIFIQTITRARWNNINMCICDPNTKKPIKKIITTSNTFNNVQNNGNSSFLGPYNNNAIQGFYEWLSFGISKTLINNYKTINNEIYVSINCGKESLENIILSGIAVCQNPYGITTIPAINLFWGNNGVQQQIDNIWTEKGIKYNNVILEESCVEILPNDVFKIKLPVLSNNKGLIIGFILNNNLWYDGNIQIYLLDNKYYELSPLIIGRYGTANLARGVYRYPKGFYIPNITNYVKIDDNGMSYIDIIIDNSKDINSTSIRGIYTELAEPE